MDNSHVTKYFSIKELLSTDNYVIPIYQRDYAWETKQIVQLVQDIADLAKKAKDNSQKTYYIGTLIAYEQRHENYYFYQTIDGQQRLTTLTLLLIYLKNEKQMEVDTSWYSKQILSFDCRKKSSDTLDSIFYGKNLYDIECNVNIKQGYLDIKKCFDTICRETGIEIKQFCDYLFNNVKILRVLVPKDTDLNHYFEIMNSRGEQLEKHEVLKAKCLERLKKSSNEQYTFNLIWEACANMERYIQYGFSTNQRNSLFGTEKEYPNYKWNKIPSEKELYEEIHEPIKKTEKSLESTQNNPEELLPNIWEIINDDKNSINPESDENDISIPIRFNPIINFSNFLLHILRIQTQKDVPLDDKRLLDIFDEFMFKGSEDEQISFIKEFGYNLLKGKLLFDKYILKRDNDKWILKRLHIYINESGKESQSYSGTFPVKEGSNKDENNDILMLLEMFHVSSPTLVYKHWLNGALNWLFKNPEPKAEDYKKYLENLAKAFLFDHYLSKSPLDYYTIIYTNSGKCITNTIEQLDEELLNKGEQVENFIFNYLDYVLWQDYKSDKKSFTFTNEPIEKKELNDERIKNFEFTFRSSVEHYYPQNPIEGEKRKIENKWLHNFGNLCLISSSKNSKLNNYMPIAKKEHYKNSDTIDSIKQRIMMNYLHWEPPKDNNDENNFNEIVDHYNKMKDCLFEQLSK